MDDVRLDDCIRQKNLNRSRAREAIYRVLLEASDECLSVMDIAARLAKSYAQKISLNTLYRHLDSFVSCKLAIVIQDDFKRAYYCAKEKERMFFIVCTKCKRIKKYQPIEQESACDFDGVEFITVHGRCQKCAS
jgi:Fe2+ or Zn2+ uptake regulation protein